MFYLCDCVDCSLALMTLLNIVNVVNQGLFCVGTKEWKGILLTGQMLYTIRKYTKGPRYSLLDIGLVYMVVVDTRQGR